MSIDELAERYRVDRNTIYQIVRTKGSPAFKVGTGRRSQWRCDTDVLEAFLLNLSKGAKG